VALGKTKLSDIINDTGLTKGHVSKYLAVLQDLGFVERIVPITEKHIYKSRLGLYKLKDNFFRFWFRFLHPYLDEFERQDIESLMARIKKELSQFVSLIFEEVICQRLWQLSAQDKLPFRFERLGRWWYKAEEIDLVALNKETDEILFGEVKWQSQLVGLKVLEELKRKSRLVKWGGVKRKEYFLLASRSGFEKSLVRKAKKEKIILLDLESLR
jgi:AAA+ ATPase superfamily predicted ATPase